MTNNYSITAEQLNESMDKLAAELDAKAAADRIIGPKGRPCHSLHCRHYDLAMGPCEVQVARQDAARVATQGITLAGLSMAEELIRKQGSAVNAAILYTATNPVDGLEATVEAIGDGSRYHVRLRDTDADETLPTILVHTSLATAINAADRLVGA